MSLAELRKRTAPAPAAGFSGVWRTVEWQPDLFAPQRFVVGVVVDANDGRRACKLMDKPGRLECFFRPAPIRQDFGWVMATARRALADVAGPAIACHNVTLGDALFVQGQTPEATAQQIYDEIVLAARAAPDDATDFVYLETPTVRELVNTELKRIAALQFEAIVRDEGDIIHDRGDHFFDVNLITPVGVGSVISAWYKAPASVERNLLRAAQDVNAYAANRHKDARAIFMMQPGPEVALPAPERKAINDFLLEECWKLECSGFRVVAQDNAAAIAADVLEWAAPQLAR